MLTQTNQLSLPLEGFPIWIRSPEHLPWIDVYERSYQVRRELDSIPGDSDWWHRVLIENSYQNHTKRKSRFEERNINRGTKTAGYEIWVGLAGKVQLKLSLITFFLQLAQRLHLPLTGNLLWILRLDPLYWYWHWLESKDLIWSLRTWWRETHSLEICLS